MSMHYILDADRNPVQVDYMTWARWFETADRRVAKTKIDEVTISTVFLGLDHRYGGLGDPILFETMLFGLAGDDTGDHERRCCTWNQALDQHAIAVDWVKRLTDSAKTIAEAELAKLI